ncbi:MAG: SH3 domain-containing protein, partial [Acetivibrio sp.]
MKKKTFLIIILTLGLIIGFNELFNYMDVVYAKSIGTVTATRLNVRTAAGTDKELLTNQGKPVTLIKGQTIQILKESKNWYQVSFTDQKTPQKGWVLSDYVKIAEDKIEEDKTEENKTEENKTEEKKGLNIRAKVDATSLKVRKTPSIKGTQLTINGMKTSLKQATEVMILKEKTMDNQNWYYISFQLNEKTYRGYVLSDYITLTFTKNVSGNIKAPKKIKVRKGAGTEKSYLKIEGTYVTLKDKQEIVVIKESRDSKEKKWFKIAFIHKNTVQTGYIAAANTKLTGTINKIGTVTAPKLNVREKAGISEKKLRYNNKEVELKKETKVTLISDKTVNNVTWYKIKFSYEDTTLTGYVSGQYISIGTSNDVIVPSESPKPSESP